MDGLRNIEDGSRSFRGSSEQIYDGRSEPASCEKPRADRFQIGTIATTHGLKGEVKVFPTTREPERFLDLKRVFLHTGRGEPLNLTVERVREGGKFFIVKFKGMDRIEDVERFRGCELTVAREDAIRLRDGEYYASDLTGLDVIDFDSGSLLGTVTDVIETGANDVYEMRRTGSEETVLLPAIRECVRQIDIEKGIMIVHMMDGL